MRVEYSHGWPECGYEFWSPKDPQVCHGLKPVTLVISFSPDMSTTRQMLSQRAKCSILTCHQDAAMFYVPKQHQKVSCLSVCACLSKGPAAVQLFLPHARSLCVHQGTKLEVTKRQLQTTTRSRWSNGLRVLRSHGKSVRTTLF